MKIFNSNDDRLDHFFDYNPVETAALRSRTYERVTLEDLRRFALWKLDRIVDVPDAVILGLQGLAMQADLSHRDELARRTLEALVACEGVGYPMASAFLKFVRPLVFPIIDVRAYRALTGKRLRYSQYSMQIYLDYADRLHEIARKRCVSLACVDEQLYCFDREHNKTIDA